MLDARLCGTHRQLTPSQREHLLLAFNEMDMPSPLYLSIAIDRTASWRSYSQAHVTMLPDERTVTALIGGVFAELQRDLGAVCIEQACGPPRLTLATSPKTQETPAFLALKPCWCYR